MKTIPTLFLSHGGGPWPWMEFGASNPYQALTNYLKKLPAMVGGKPKAILMVSGHWEEKSFTVMTHPRPPMLYDYYGFPENTYKVRYPAPGATDLVPRVHELLEKAGIPLQENAERGYDHGTFTPMAVSFPEADVPILQLSMKRGYDVTEHIALGKALAPLRDEGVLIIGSGLSYHNLREFGSPNGVAAAGAFDAWLTQAMQATGPAREDLLKRWSTAPAARLAHPREDHLIPLMVAVGAASTETATKVYSDQMFGLEVSGFQFGR